MNIFLTDPCPRESAIALDDKRIVKMALETAQMLSSSVILMTDTKSRDLYGITHERHPCSVWARSSCRAFLWLHDHGVSLCDEYSRRFDGRVHKSREVIDACFYEFRRHSGGRMPLETDKLFDFNSSGYLGKDVFDSYRLCMADKWVNLDSRRPKWTYRGKPSWFNDYKEKVT